MPFFDNHQKLFAAALGVFLTLTCFVAIIPALSNQSNNAPLPTAKPMSSDAIAGKQIYISNGCVACHTQQVRNVDMDENWGNRPGIAADYAANLRTDFWRNTATLMGTERTGPDLTNIGKRQPSQAWHLLHLFQPRAVVQQSIMPAYPWLFEIKNSVGASETEVIIPDPFRKGITGKVVAKKEALQLVAYLQSLEQADLIDGRQAPAFLYKPVEARENNNTNPNQPDGKLLYANNCQSCHQENGEGLKGAFPPLKGSPIVQGDDLELFVRIIMQGYDARPEYAVMSAVGTNNKLSYQEVAAIMNHERSSWGNNAKQVDPEEVKKIIAFINETSVKK